MASRAYQQLLVFKAKKKTDGSTSRPSLNVFLVKKTGYYNLWINGTHYYYNEKDIVSSIKDVDMKDYFPASNKKGVIVIQKK